MSKRAPLTLRKPGQRPAPRAIEDFIDCGDQEHTEKAHGSSLAPVPISEPVPELSAGTGVTAQASPPTQTTGPHEPLSEPGDVPTFRRATRSISKRKTKPDRRRATVYMDIDLARKLAAHCATNELDMSDAVNAALRAYLA
jgi:hypothetical protein